MRKRLSKLIQYVLFPAFGLAIIWYLYKDQKATEILDILKNDMNFAWIGLSVLLGLLSHVSRAMRWQMLIEPVEKKPGLNNTFWSVMTGYLANLVFPRMGEVSRCGVLSKYENMSFPRVVGTVVIERLFDLSMLILISIIVLTIQFDTLGSFLARQLKFDSIGEKLYSPTTWFVILSIPVVILFVKRLSKKHKLFARFSSLWENFTEGFTSIRKVKNKPLFLFHTFFIWLMYFLMIYVPFFSLEATSHLSVGAGLTILFTGSLGMLAPVQGGLGPWHFMVIATLKMYGIPADVAGIFALVVHAAQNTMIIITGLLAFVILPITNRQKMILTEA
ncbi:UPF0104 family protein [Marinilabiliaceae bacterium JC017]|nr:UPF0104 family protein [Marinilabiliaceae bacterium JC017]